MCSADPGREARHVPSPGECGFPIHHSTRNRCEQPAARGEERCAARCNYELQTNKKKEKMTKTQQAVSSVNAFSPGSSILGINGIISETLSVPRRTAFSPPCLLLSSGFCVPQCYATRPWRRLLGLMLSQSF